MDRSSFCGFEMQSLESRMLLSGVTAAAAPSASAPDAHLAALVPVVPGDLLTKAMRQNLLNHWSGPNRGALAAKLKAGKLGAFDERLLSYMRGRPGQNFFWKQSDVSGIVSFIKTNIATAKVIEDADNIVGHRFPEQGNSDSYAIQLSTGAVDWSTQPKATSNQEFLQGLNRHEFWLDLAQAQLITGDSKYTSELVAELVSWSQQNPALADPNTWRAAAPHWSLLDASVRAGSWSWTYQMVLGSPSWSPAANTLMLAKLQEHGDFLRRVEPFSLASNRSLVHAHGLLEIAQLMPEFKGAAEWEKYSRKLLFGAMDHQLYADGGHVEESPTYAANAINDLLEAYWLDQVKGDLSKWPAKRRKKLHNAMESHVQLLSPNGELAALSDAYRSTKSDMLTKARIVLGNTGWPAATPRMRDVWLFGPERCEPLLPAPVSPTLEDRGKSYGMSDSGYYIMRSGADPDARQITFDAGPTGGIHGHLDLLNFELFGYGKVLISDPGLYKYGNSASRRYVLSTAAHNTISVDGANHAALEDAHNPGIVVDQWSPDVDHAQVAAHHSGYEKLAGAPMVGRSIWYDYDGTALIVDWGQSTARHSYAIAFNLPGDENTVSGVQPDGSIHTNYGFGNVKVTPLLRSGQTASRGELSFVSNRAPPSGNDPAYRFTVAGTGKFQVFATLVTSYSGTTAPNITAEWITKTPEAGQPIVLRLTKNGVSRDITFAAPVRRPPRNFSSTTAAANDLAYDDSGQLHMAYFDRSTRNLKYSVRDANGRWSVIKTIDPGLDSGVYVSLALDSKGSPGVAYFDGNAGDLKFAKLQTNGAWDVQTVDSKGSVGLYPSLVFGRGGDPIITYYHRTDGDLRVAAGAKSGWSVGVIDSKGDVGRFSSVQIDPNRPDASKIAVAYENTSGGTYKYAIQGKTSGWRYATIDSDTTEGGGYTSLQFTPVKAADGAFRPSASYYDAGNSALKFAAFDGKTWRPQTVVADGKIGLYTSLVYDDDNRANIFFFDKSGNRAYRGTLNRSKWSFARLGAGGREMSVARRSKGGLAYSTLDDSAPLLEVGFLTA